MGKSYYRAMLGRKSVYANEKKQFEKMENIMQAMMLRDD